MEWTRLLSTKRQRPGRHQDVRSADTDLRSEFEKDYHRIIGSASFSETSGQDTGISIR